MMNSVNIRTAALACIAATILALGTQAASSAADPSNPAAGEWPSYGRDYAEQRFSPLNKINTANVSKLGLAWSYDFRVGRGVEGTPLMVNGVLYVTSAWSIVYALDAKTGKELWVFDPKADRVQGAKACCDVVNRGVAYLDGRIFVGVIDGRLISLNAKTGRQLWETQTVDKSQPYTISGAPRAAKGLVFIGNSGADLGVRGYASAYDAKTGKLVWRFYTVPGDPAKGPDNAASDDVMAMAAKTWNGQWWRQGGGGTVWDSITYDPELDRVYLGVGNGSPWNRQIRSPGGGDNLFLASIVAVDRATGHYIWHYQTTPGETWDHTATQSIILATLKIEGKDRRVLMQAPKNGFFYVIDRDTGKLISARNIVPMAKAADTPAGQAISWAYGVDLATGRPLENPEARVENGTVAFVHPIGNGAHSWYPMAFNATTGLAYFPTQDPAGWFKSNPDYVPKPFTRAHGFSPVILGKNSAVPTVGNNALIAWNPITQKEVWRVPFDVSANGGVLTTAGGLVFEASGVPELAAYDALSGTRLWSYDVQAGAQGGPISYEIGGEQYIAVATGNGGIVYMVGTPSIPDKPAPDKGRLLVFKLGATASLPALAKSLPLIPPPPVIEASEQAIQSGAGLYGAYCGGCHGMGANSRRVVPDLRRSGFIQSAEAFQLVVREGALAQNGMPNLGAALSSQEAEDIRVYLASVAAAAYRLQEETRH
ncbi:MAG: PQQ-dependent dehydrogenase, methanol/ethanol family [Steroidobacteraceae bacterium]